MEQQELIEMGFASSEGALISTIWMTTDEHGAIHALMNSGFGSVVQTYMSLRTASEHMPSTGGDIFTATKQIYLKAIGRQEKETEERAVNADLILRIMYLTSMGLVAVRKVADATGGPRLIMAFPFGLKSNRDASTYIDQDSIEPTYDQLATTLINSFGLKLGRNAVELVLKAMSVSGPLSLYIYTSGLVLQQTHQVSGGTDSLVEIWNMLSHEVDTKITPDQIIVHLMSLVQKGAITMTAKSGGDVLLSMDFNTGYQRALEA